MISYEFPLNERIRTLLRLEDLFSRFGYFVAKTDPQDHHSALLALFEIVDVASRADLKSELIQELERQKQILEGLRHNPQIAEDALESVLTEIEATSSRLLDIVGRFGQYLRENEWLMSIKQRTSIPGGACEFDLPSYFFWQRCSAQHRQNDLAAWVAPMLPVREGLSIVLRLLRDSGKTFHYLAKSGTFQQMSGGKQFQLLKVSLDERWPCVPEVSANKYAINVRFLQPMINSSDKSRQFDQDTPFDLTYFSL